MSAIPPAMARVLTALRAARGVATASELSRATGLPGLDVVAALSLLSERRLVRLGQRGGWSAVAVAPTTLRMAPGMGERRTDCARYEACLSAFSRARSDDGHCPSACPHYAPAQAGRVDEERPDLLRSERAAWGEW